MPEYIGDIEIPVITASGTFPLVSDFPHGHAQAPEVAVHQFGSGNAKIEQRFLLGNGTKRFTVHKAALKETDREALRDFWETSYGPYGAFTYNAPDDDNEGTTSYTVRFANEPLSWEFLSDQISTVGVTLIEIPNPASAPTYTLNSTSTRFPGTSLKTALLSQVQQIVPLVKIQVRETGYPAIYVSDRRCTVGGQLYLARLLDFDGIQQSIGNASDEARFIFGNADRVMKDLAADTDLNRATIEFSLFHVGTGIKLDLWKGEISNWSFDDGPEFRVTASDGMYELNMPYPTRKISRTCWKCFDDANGCPYTAQGAMDYTHFPTASPTSCDKSYDGANGCLAHGMKKYFGGILAEPQSVTIKDNSTGTWGWRRSSLTSVSLVAESIYDQVIPEIYTDTDMPVNCKIAAGRDESDFFDALGIVGEGPLTFGPGHTLDGQYHHGHPGTLGLRSVTGSDPAGATEPFSLGQSGSAGGDWRKMDFGGNVYKDNFAAGTAFLELRRQDEKGLQLAQVTSHAMQAVVRYGLQGWIWTATLTRTQQILTNPVWIVVNAMLRARGLRFASAAVAEQYFDLDAALAAAAICDAGVTPLIARTETVWVPETEEVPGHWDTNTITTEAQFRFRGVLQDEKPLRDWIQEILMNCQGFYSFAFGKLRLGIRSNSSVVEAFTEGNILFHSLRPSALAPAFNHLTAFFADAEFEGTTNSVQVYDIDHAKLIGSSTAPQFIKSQMNLSGAATKSQAARIVATRLREELGGITAAQWKAARQIAYGTTVLSLNTEPGMVCSMTHTDMPAGACEFRITEWKLNRDYSIEIQGRTTVDEMYDLTTGPKPADIQASAVPVEMPAGVRSVGGKSIGGVGNTTGAPTGTQIFTQDDSNVDIYRRKFQVEFTPSPTAYNNIFSRRTNALFLSTTATGGSITPQTLYVEVVPQQSGVDGLPSNLVEVVIPPSTGTNKFKIQARLPAEATHYSVRIGSYPGRMFLCGSVTVSPGSDWFDIEILSLASLNSASLSPDPLFDHVRFFYYYSGRVNELHDGGRTAEVTQNSFIFEPEIPESGDTTITIFACAANALETDVYPLADAPAVTVAITLGSPTLDLVLPGAPDELTVTTPAGRSTGLFLISWKIPATGNKTLCDYCIQYDTVATFDSDPHIWGRGHWGLYDQLFDPSKTYYFRVAAQNKSQVGSNGVVKAALDATGYGSTTNGWGPFCSYIGPRTSLHIFDYATRQVRTQDLGIAIATSVNLAGSARSQHGIFMESWEDSFEGWTLEAGNAPTFLSTGGRTGAKVLRAAGWFVGYLTTPIPWDDSKLCRERVRLRMHAFTEAASTYIWVCLRCYDGAGTYIGEIYPTCAALQGSTLTIDQWYEYTGYIKGSGTPGGVVHPLATDPEVVNTGTVYVRPLVYLNHYPSGPVGNVIDVDYLSIDPSDEGATDRAYRGLDSSGIIQTEVPTARLTATAQSGISRAVAGLTEGGAVAVEVPEARLTTNVQGAVSRAVAGLTTDGDVARTITAVTFRTSISGTRIEITGSTLKGYYGADVIFSVDGEQVMADDLQAKTALMVGASTADMAALLSTSITLVASSTPVMALTATYLSFGSASAVINIGGNQVLGARGAAVADATDAASVILRFNEWLARARTHGLITT